MSLKFLSLLLLLALASFGMVTPSTAQAPAPGKQKSKPDIIRIATHRTSYKAALEEIARRYEALHPGVRIELTFISGSQLATYIRTREAAGLDLVPDIYNGNMTKGYDAQGKWISLSPYLEQINPYTGKKFKDSFRKLNVYEFDNYGGELYMLPIDLISVGLYYNKDLFQKLEIDLPQTWEAFIEACKKIQAAGYDPISVPGDFDSLWAGNIGWIVRALNDAYLRDKIPLVVTQPGDWDFDPVAHSSFAADSDDPFFDRQMLINAERVINAIESGEIDFQSSAFRQAYQKLYELSQYFQSGFIGSDLASAQNAFLRQEAAMIFAGSQFVFSHQRFNEQSPPERRFETGITWLPPIIDDPLAHSPIRGFFNSSTLLSVTKKKDPAHEARVIDFLMYLTTPSSGQLIHDLTLENGYDLTGPLTIKGVNMLPSLEEQYKAFGKNGVVKLEFRGLFDEQKSIGDYVVHIQDYLGGRTTIDEFLAAYDRSMSEAVKRMKQNYGYDLDPTTRDYKPARERRIRKWNPFDNSLLAICILAGGYLVFVATNLFRTKKRARKRATMGYLLITPSIALLLVFDYWPALSSIYFSLTDWSSWQYPNFIGLGNFIELATDDQFFLGFANMMALLLAAVVKATVFPFIAAQLVLHVLNTRMQQVFRTLILFPIVVPTIVIVLVWKNIFNPSSGLINQTLIALGAESLTQSWLGDHSLALSSIIFTGFPWVGAIGFLVYLAALMNISSDVKDAFSLESSSWLTRVRHVDIPLVRSETRLLVILSVIASIQEIQVILLLTGGGPGLATHVPAYSMYKEAFVYGNFGYGSAIGAVLFLLILGITLFNLRFLKKSEVYS